MSTLTEAGSGRRRGARRGGADLSRGDQRRARGRDGRGPDASSSWARTSTPTAACSRPTSGCPRSSRAASWPRPSARTASRASPWACPSRACGPIVEIMFADFLPTAGDAIVNQLPKYRYMSGGQFAVPVTRARHHAAAAAGFGTQHSATGESWYMAQPGMRVAAASSPGCRVRAAAGGHPRQRPGASFHEHKVLYARKGPVRRGAIAEVGKARGAARGHGRDDRGHAADGRAGARRRRARWPRRASARRSSTCAGSGRWTMRDDRGVGRARPAGWSSPRSSGTRAAGAPRSSAKLAQTRHAVEGVADARSACRTTCSSPTARRSRTRSCPSAERIAAAARASGRSVTADRGGSARPPRRPHALDRSSLHHRAHRDDRAPGAARPAVRRQRLLDGQPDARSSRACTPRTGWCREVYNGDTDDEQALVVGIIHDELAPRRHRPQRDRPRGRLAGDGAVHQQHPARPRAWRSRPSPASTPPSGTSSARRVGLPLHRLWGSVTDSLPMSVIGGYYHLDAGADRARLIAGYAERLRGREVQGRRPDARGGRRARPRRA